MAIVRRVVYYSILFMGIEQEVSMNNKSLIIIIVLMSLYTVIAEAIPISCLGEFINFYAKHTEEYLLYQSSQQKYTDGNLCCAK